MTMRWRSYNHIKNSALWIHLIDYVNKLWSCEIRDKSAQYRQTWKWAAQILELSQCGTKTLSWAPGIYNIYLWGGGNAIMQIKQMDSSWFAESKRFPYYTHFILIRPSNEPLLEYWFYQQGTFSHTIAPFSNLLLLALIKSELE